MEPLERRNSLYSDQKIETKRKDSKGLAVELKERLRDDLDLATLRTLTAHIIQRFDYEYIRTHFSEEEWFIGTMRELVLTLAHVVKVANALNDYPDQCLAQSDGLIGILLAYQNTLQADGMLKDKVEGVVALYDTGMRTRETLMRIRSDAHRAVELAQSYRSNPSTVEMRAGELVDLINDIEKLFMAKSSELLVRDEQLYLNSSLDEALALGLNACYDRLPKHDFALTTKSELPKESSLVTPLVMNDTTASTDAVTMQYLQREVERLCPPAFRKIVAKVVFMNLVPDQQNTGWHKAGNYLLDEETGLATIRINLVPF